MNKRYDSNVCTGCGRSLNYYGRESIYDKGVLYCVHCIDPEKKIFRIKQEPFTFGEIKPKISLVLQCSNPLNNPGCLGKFIETKISKEGCINCHFYAK